MSEVIQRARLARPVYLCTIASVVISFAGQLTAETLSRKGFEPLGPLPRVSSTAAPDQIALGKLLFHDPRLSGDATISCASCHNPDKAWTDRLKLSKGYPGSLYFRNTPSIINIANARYAYWDGRLPASDLPTLVRDHISEAHFMQADGRLVIERLRQVPRYEKGFRKAFGGEPTYGRILNAVAAYLETIKSEGSPFERHLAGKKFALSNNAKSGLALFVGKAGCVRCHDGPMLSDGKLHHLGIESGDDIFATPLRHISFRRFFRTLGVSEYARLRTDAGHYAVTKQRDDFGAFRTPSLWEVGRTAPYMHDGSLPTLEHVVEFYDEGGGPADGKDARLKRLRLTAAEKADLAEFLRSLSGTLPEESAPDLPPYQLRKLGEN